MSQNLEKNQNLDTFVSDLQDEILQQAHQQYSAKVIEHWLNPRNPGSMENPDGHARIQGPCGDTMEIFIRVNDEKITRANFITDGCMTTIVSGSMATELATDMDVAGARAISQELILKQLGDLPEESRHCALLAANTLREAIEDYQRNAKES